MKRISDYDGFMPTGRDMDGDVTYSTQNTSRTPATDGLRSGLNIAYVNDSPLEEVSPYDRTRSLRPAMRASGRSRER
jgi:hypothetical protein